LLICQQRFLLNVFNVFIFSYKTRFLTVFILGVNVFYIYAFEDHVHRTSCFSVKLKLIIELQY